MRKECLALALAALMVVTSAASLFQMTADVSGDAPEDGVRLMDFRLEINNKTDVRDHLNDRSLEPEGAVYRIVEDESVPSFKRGDACFIDGASGWSVYVCATDVQEPVIMGTRTCKHIPDNWMGDYTEEGTFILLMTVGTGPDYEVITQCRVTVYDPLRESNDRFYFFIKIEDDTWRKDATIQGVPDIELKEGFWVTGRGEDASVALMNVCTENGWQLEYDTTLGYRGWIGKFLNLETHLEDGVYRYWVQYNWDGQGWVFNDLCLGYLKTKEYRFIGLTFMLSTMDGMMSNIGQGPETIDESMYFNEDKESGAWDTRADGITLDRVPIRKRYEYGKLGYDIHSMNAGSTFMFKACVLPRTATDRSVTWESSDTSVATVDAFGNVTALKAGTTVVKATSKDGGYTAECELTVSAEGTKGNRAGGGFTYIGGSGQVTCKSGSFPVPESELRNVRYASLDNSVLRVDEKGTTTGIAYGETEVIAYVGDDWEDAKGSSVKVYFPPTSDWFSLSPMTLEIGSSKPVVMTFSERGGIEREWNMKLLTNIHQMEISSNEENVVKIGENGRLLGVSEGISTVTVTYWLGLEFRPEMVPEGARVTKDVQVTVVGDPGGAGDGNAGDEGDGPVTGGDVPMYAIGGAGVAAVAAAAVLLIRRR